MWKQPDRMSSAPTGVVLWVGCSSRTNNPRWSTVSSCRRVGNKNVNTEGRQATSHTDVTSLFLLFLSVFFQNHKCKHARPSVCSVSESWRGVRAQSVGQTGVVQSNRRCWRRVFKWAKCQFFSCDSRGRQGGIQNRSIQVYAWGYT